MDLRNNDHRRRLLDAMAAAIADKGYPAVTIADLAAEARVSKRSFYEQFRDKVECFITLYDELSSEAVQALEDALHPTAPWQGQIEHVLGSYFSMLCQRPVMLQILIVEVMSIGPEGLAARRRTNDRFANFILRASQHQLTREHAVGIIASLHEWVLEALEQKRLDTIPALVQPGADLIRAMMMRGPQQLAGHEPDTAPA